MGYYSAFHVSIFNETTKEQITSGDDYDSFHKDIEEYSGYDFEFTQDGIAHIWEAKWYDYIEDIKQVLKLYENMRVVVDRYGEDNEDISRTAIVNDQTFRWEVDATPPDPFDLQPVKIQRS